MSSPFSYYFLDPGAPDPCRYTLGTSVISSNYDLMKHIADKMQCTHLDTFVFSCRNTTRWLTFTVQIVYPHACETGQDTNNSHMEIFKEVAETIDWTSLNWAISLDTYLKGPYAIIVKDDHYGRYFTFEEFVGFIKESNPSKGRSERVQCFNEEFHTCPGQSVSRWSMTSLDRVAMPRLPDFRLYDRHGREIHLSWPTIPVKPGMPQHIAGPYVRGWLQENTEATCPISLESLKDQTVLLVPTCGHICSSAAQQLTTCPVCRITTGWTQVKN